MLQEVESPYMIYPDPSKDKDWQNHGEEKPLNPEKSYRLAHTVNEDFWFWPEDPNAQMHLRIGSLYTKTQNVLEQKKEKPIPAWYPKIIGKLIKGKRLQENSISEVKSCMTAQDELIAIRKTVVEKVQKALQACFNELKEVEWNRDSALQLIARKVHDTIEELNIPKLIQDANQRLIPEGPYGKPRFGYGGFNLSIIGNDDIIIALEKDDLGRYFLQQNQKRGCGACQCGNRTCHG